MGIGRRLREWIHGAGVISLAKYEALEAKYKELVDEFRRYRYKTEMLQDGFKMRIKTMSNLIENLEKTSRINNDILTLLLPYVVTGTPMRSNDKHRLNELEKEKTESIFHASKQEL